MGDLSYLDNLTPEELKALCLKVIADNFALKRVLDADYMGSIKAKRGVNEDLVELPCGCMQSSFLAVGPCGCPKGRQLNKQTASLYALLN